MSGEAVCLSAGRSGAGDWISAGHCSVVTAVRWPTIAHASPLRACVTLVDSSTLLKHPRSQRLHRAARGATSSAAAGGRDETEREARDETRRHGSDAMHDCGWLDQCAAARRDSTTVTATTPQSHTTHPTPLHPESASGRTGLGCWLDCGRVVAAEWFFRPVALLLRGGRKAAHEEQKQTVQRTEQER